jgi:hypothetical protein
MHTVSKTTNALENLLQMGRDVLKKEEAKIYTDPFFSTCTLLLLLIPCVLFSNTLGELQPRISNVALLAILESMPAIFTLFALASLGMDLQVFWWRYLLVS